MPRKKRERLKRIMAQAHYHADESIRRVAQLHDMFEPVHPTHAEYLMLICQSIYQSQEMMKDFWQKSWGVWPKNLEVYQGIAKKE
jgi:hypothetical protein